MDHARKINKVIDHITRNLDMPLHVGVLAAIAGLSEYHFQRVFRDAVGEPVAKYIARLRLEKAARLLSRDDDALIATVAEAAGFGSASVFCRNFKRHFGLSPQQYRSRKAERESINGQSQSTNDEAPYTYTRYFCSRRTIKLEGKTMNCTFEIKTLAPMQVVYARHRGAYDEMGEAIRRLMQWAYPRGLVNGFPRLGSVYIDDPAITPKDKLQSDAFLVVDGDVKVDGDIGKYTIDGGKYAVGRFEIAMEEFGDAWGSMCTLIADSGLVATDGYHYEMYLNNFDEHPHKKFIVNICIPVKPL